jgi:hypothetical protein
VTCHLIPFVPTPHFLTRRLPSREPTPRQSMVTSLYFELTVGAIELFNSSQQSSQQSTPTPTPTSVPHSRRLPLAPRQGVLNLTPPGLEDDENDGLPNLTLSGTMSIVSTSSGSPSGASPSATGKTLRGSFGFDDNDPDFGHFRVSPTLCLIDV